MRDATEMIRSLGLGLSRNAKPQPVDSDAVKLIKHCSGLRRGVFARGGLHNDALDGVVGLALYGSLGRFARVAGSGCMALVDRGGVTRGGEGFLGGSGWHERVEPFHCGFCCGRGAVGVVIAVSAWLLSVGACCARPIVGAGLVLQRPPLLQR